MTENNCRCGKPTRDTNTVCEHCLDQLARALGEVPWTTEQLEISVTRQKGIDYRTVGGSKGGKKPAERPAPANWGASEARTHLHGLLVSWVRLCDADKVRHSSPDDTLPADNLIALSRWLLWRVDGLALHEAGSDAVDEITDAVAQCHRVIDRPADRWFAGPCNEEHDGVECGTDLYAKATSGDVKCRSCAAVYDVDSRRAWLLAAAEDRLASAKDLARSVSWLGATPLTADRVRQWASRGRIVAKGHDGASPLYRVGDAIDLMAASPRGGAA